jgi:hypothetical protein
LVLPLSRLLGLSAFLLICLTAADPEQLRHLTPSQISSSSPHRPFFHSLRLDSGDFHLLRILRVQVYRSVA